MQDRKIIIQTALQGPVDIPLPPPRPPSASKTNRTSGTDSGVHANELPDRGCEASSQRLGSHCECQFDIFDQLRKRIKQSFFPPWSLLNVRPEQSCGARKEPCVAFHCAVNTAAVQTRAVGGGKVTETFALRGKSNIRDQIKWWEHCFSLKDVPQVAECKEICELQDRI